MSVNNKSSVRLQRLYSVKSNGYSVLTIRRDRKYIDAVGSGGRLTYIYLYIQSEVSGGFYRSREWAN